MDSYNFEKTPCRPKRARLNKPCVGTWPSGRATLFGSADRRFESYRPSQYYLSHCWIPSEARLRTSYAPHGAPELPTGRQVDVRHHTPIKDLYLSSPRPFALLGNREKKDVTGVASTSPLIGISNGRKRMKRGTAVPLCSSSPLSPPLLMNR